MNGKTDLRGTAAGRSADASTLKSTGSKLEGGSGVHRGSQDPSVRRQRPVQVLRLRPPFRWPSNGTEIRIYGVRTSSVYLALDATEGGAGGQPEGRPRGDGVCSASGAEGVGDASSRSQARRAHPLGTSDSGCGADRGAVRVNPGSPVPGEAERPEEARQALDGVGDHHASAIEAARHHSRGDGHQ